jgi:dTDP-4-amino-4,6-dideoxygalactose transaminase
LDLAEPAIVERQEWGTLLCSQLNQAKVGLGKVREPRDWDSQIVDLCKIPGALFEPDNYVEKQAQKVEFLENKSTYSSMVDYLLQLSATENHWSNYGPVTRLLEQVIAKMIKLPDYLSVITCSSATSGLEGLVSLEEELAGRQLNWVVPAYTFPSSLSVCRGTAQVIDVHEDGQFSLDHLGLLPVNSYDAVLVTNLFGRSSSLDQLIKFCEFHGKKLVLDNATGLNANIERTANWPGEAISFHHTKVWGMGEGGCIVCKQENETMLRALLSPGLQAPVSPERRRNAKLDDFSSARILARLIYTPRWQSSYDWQMWRIEQAALAAGFSLFGPESHAYSNRASSSFTPLLAPQRLDLAVNNTSRVTLQKYYRPLASKPVADDLFSRVLAVPNHLGMAQFSNSELKELLQNIIVSGMNKRVQKYLFLACTVLEQPC